MSGREDFHNYYYHGQSVICKAIVKALNKRVHFFPFFLVPSGRIEKFNSQRSRSKRIDAGVFLKGKGTDLFLLKISIK